MSLTNTTQTNLDKIAKILEKVSSTSNTEKKTREKFEEHKNSTRAKSTEAANIFFECKQLMKQDQMNEMRIRLEMRKLGLKVPKFKRKG
jgi:hypothetical protein